MARPNNPRPGMGRKVLPPEERKVRRVVWLEPETDSVLLAHTRNNEALGRVIDRLVKEGVEASLPE